MKKLLIFIVMWSLLAFTGIVYGAGEDIGGIRAGTIDNTAYDATEWNGVTTLGASKDALRDKFESLGAGIFAGSNITYVLIGDNIETVAAAATAGDSLVLAAGTYTITDDIDIAQSLNIIGQGRGITTILTTADNKHVFHITASNVTIQDLSISIEADDTEGFHIDGLAGSSLTGVLIKDIDITSISHAGIQRAFLVSDAGGTNEIRDVVYVGVSSSTSVYGIWFENATTDDADAYLNCYNVDVSCTASANAAVGFYSYDNSADKDTFLNLYNCRAYATGATDYGILAANGDAYVYAENCILSGDTYDAINDTATVRLRDCTLVKNLTSGTITYEGRIGGATYGSDGTVTDAELLYINSLSGNAQDQFDAKEVQLTNEAGLYGVLNDVSNFLQDNEKFTGQVTVQAFGNADATPDVSNAALGVNNVYYSDSNGTITDFDDGDGAAHDEFADGDWFIFGLRDASTIVDFSENLNIEGNAGVDLTGSATQLVYLLFLYESARWNCVNFTSGFSDPTTLAISTVQAAMKVYTYAGVQTLTAPQMNSIIVMTGAGDVNIPADQCDTATGKWITVKSTAVHLNSLTSNDAADLFVLLDGTELDAQDELDLGGAAGNQVTCVCLAANKWYVTGEIGTCVDGDTAD